MDPRNMTDSQTSTRTSTDVNGDQTSHFNGNETSFGDHAPIGQQAPCDSYMLISNLRMQLQIALEKNSWLQKGIEDLKEERDFLRCQLDRSISITKSLEFNADREDDPPQHSPMKARLSPCPLPPPMPTRSTSKQTCTRRKRPSAPKEGPTSAHKSGSRGSGSSTGGGSPWNRNRKGKPSSRRKTDVSFEDVVEEYMDDPCLEEMEEDLNETSCEDEGNKPKRRWPAPQSNDDGTHVMRTLLFRVKRCMERQRVKDPAGVLIRYNKILVTYQKLKSMAKAFQVHGVDRNTVASTTPIAEMLLVAPEKVSEVGEFDSSKEKLLEYARRCYKAMDEQALAKVQELKKNNLLLPITYRFRN